MDFYSENVGRLSVSIGVGYRIESLDTSKRRFFDISKYRFDVCEQPYHRLVSQESMYRNTVFFDISKYRFFDA